MSYPVHVIRSSLLIAYRFSDLLTHSSAILPGAAYELDPTVDYGVHKAILHTMATCHSLRLVDDLLVGDPLDYKMFEFSGWIFEEGGKTSSHEEVDEHMLSPSIARPRAGTYNSVDMMASTVRALAT